MIKKKLIIPIFILFVGFVISYNILVSGNCKNHSISKIIDSISGLGFGHVKVCVSKSNAVGNIKSLLKNNEFLYQVARKYRRTYQMSFIKYDNAFEKEDIEYVDKKIIEEKNLKKPFIKGLIEGSPNTFNKNLIYNNDNEYTSWFRSHGGYRNTHYDSNDYINKNNISNLKLQWVYKSLKDDEIEKKWVQTIETNPIFFDNKIIAVTADWKIVALNSLTGNLIWEIQAIHQPSRRGMLAEYDKISKKNYLYIPIGNQLYKIDIEDGKKVKKFGNNGYIKNYSKTAPMIYNNKLITVYSGVDIFDKFNGKKLKRIEFHPNRNFLGGVAWAGVALDEKKGIVYAATGNPRPASYGVNRKGNNKNTSSIIAVDINEQKIKWTFQETSHDVWDYDIASPPIIFDLVVENKIYETVITPTKVGNTLILERNTGKPIFDINYREAPVSNMTGDYTSKYQIFLKKPERFSKIEFSLDDISSFSGAKEAEIQKKMKNAIYGWYEPPAFGKDLFLFGLHGGAEWAGAAIDPLSQSLFIPVNNDPWIIRPQILSREIKTSVPKNLKKNYEEYLNLCSSCHGIKRNGKNKDHKEATFNYVPGLVGIYKFPELKYKMSSLKNVNKIHEKINIDQNQLNRLQDLFTWWDKELDNKKQIKIVAGAPAWSLFRTKDGLPGSNPPWGYIAKLDLLTGKILWKSPIGYTDIDGKSQKVGTISFGGLAVNSGGIIFFTGTEDGKAYAIDSDNGQELWSYQMDGIGTAPPIIYNIEEKQFVSFVSTGRNFIYTKNKNMKKSSNIYTFSIN